MEREVVLLLVAIIFGTSAAPVFHDDLSPERNCLFDGKFYGHGLSIETEDPCLNCTCNRGVLVCFLRVCPNLVPPPNSGCSLQKASESCCAELVCGTKKENTTMETAAETREDGLDVSSHTESSDSTLATYFSTLEAQEEVTLPPYDFTVDDDAISMGCRHNGSLYAEGSAMLSSSFCEYCYCIRGTHRCIRPQCHLTVDDCAPIYHNGFSCCPTAYQCRHNSSRENITTTTAWTKPVDRNDCEVNGTIYKEGDPVGTSDVCNHCFCVKGKVRCSLISCPLQLEGCKPIIQPRKCCPTGYSCSSLKSSQTAIETSTEALGNVTSLAYTDGSALQNRSNESVTSSTSAGVTEVHKDNLPSRNNDRVISDDANKTESTFPSDATVTTELLEPDFLLSATESAELNSTVVSNEIAGRREVANETATPNFGLETTSVFGVDFDEASTTVTQTVEKNDSGDENSTQFFVQPTVNSTTATPTMVLNYFQNISLPSESTTDVDELVEANTSLDVENPSSTTTPNLEHTESVFFSTEPFVNAFSGSWDQLMFKSGNDSEDVFEAESNLDPVASNDTSEQITQQSTDISSSSAKILTSSSTDFPSSFADSLLFSTTDSTSSSAETLSSSTDTASSIGLTDLLTLSTEAPSSATDTSSSATDTSSSATDTQSLPSETPTSLFENFASSTEELSTSTESELSSSSSSSSSPDTASSQTVNTHGPSNAGRIAPSRKNDTFEDVLTVNHVTTELSTSSSDNELETKVTSQQSATEHSEGPKGQQSDESATNGSDIGERNDESTTNSVPSVVLIHSEESTSDGFGEHSHVGTESWNAAELIGTKDSFQADESSVSVVEVSTNVSYFDGNEINHVTLSNAMLINATSGDIEVSTKADDLLEIKYSSEPTLSATIAQQNQSLFSSLTSILNSLLSTSFNVTSTSATPVGNDEFVDDEGHYMAGSNDLHIFNDSADNMGALFDDLVGELPGELQFNSISYLNFSDSAPPDNLVKQSTDSNLTDSLVNGTVPTATHQPPEVMVQTSISMSVEEFENSNADVDPTVVSAPTITRSTTPAFDQSGLGDHEDSFAGKHGDQERFAVTSDLPATDSGSGSEIAENYFATTESYEGTLGETMELILNLSKTYTSMNKTTVAWKPQENNTDDFMLKGNMPHDLEAKINEIVRFAQANINSTDEPDNIYSMHIADDRQRNQTGEVSDLTVQPEAYFEDADSKDHSSSYDEKWPEFEEESIKNITALLNSTLLSSLFNQSDGFTSNFTTADTSSAFAGTVGEIGTALEDRVENREAISADEEPKDQFKDEEIHSDSVDHGSAADVEPEISSFDHPAAPSTQHHLLDESLPEKNSSKSSEPTAVPQVDVAVDEPSEDNEWQSDDNVDTELEGHHSFTEDDFNDQSQHFMDSNREEDVVKEKIDELPQQDPSLVAEDTDDSYFSQAEVVVPDEEKSYFGADDFSGGSNKKQEASIGEGVVSAVVDTAEKASDGIVSATADTAEKAPFDTDEKTTDNDPKQVTQDDPNHSTDGNAAEHDLNHDSGDKIAEHGLSHASEDKTAEDHPKHDEHKEPTESPVFQEHPIFDEKIEVSTQNAESTLEHRILNTSNSANDDSEILPLDLSEFTRNDTSYANDTTLTLTADQETNVTERVPLSTTLHSIDTTEHDDAEFFEETTKFVQTSSIYNEVDLDNSTLSNKEVHKILNESISSESKISVVVNKDVLDLEPENVTSATFKEGESPEITIEDFSLPPFKGEVADVKITDVTTLFSHEDASGVKDDHVASSGISDKISLTDTGSKDIATTTLFGAIPEEELGDAVSVLSSDLQGHQPASYDREPPTIFTSISEYPHEEATSFVGLVSKGSIHFDNVLPLSRRGRPTTDERTGLALPTPRKSEDGPISSVPDEVTISSDIRVIPFLPEDAIPERTHEGTSKSDHIRNEENQELITVSSNTSDAPNAVLEKNESSISIRVGASSVVHIDDASSPESPHGFKGVAEPVLIENESGNVSTETTPAGVLNITSITTWPETKGIPSSTMPTIGMTLTFTSAEITEQLTTTTMSPETPATSTSTEYDGTTTSELSTTHFKRKEEKRIDLPPAHHSATDNPLFHDVHGNQRHPSNLGGGHRSQDYCVENGEVFQNGERIPTLDFCAQCRCNKGEIMCQHVACHRKPLGCVERILPSSCCPSFVCNETDSTEGDKSADDLPIRSGITIQGGFLPIERPVHRPAPVLDNFDPHRHTSDEKPLPENNMQSLTTTPRQFVSMPPLTASTEKLPFDGSLEHTGNDRDIALITNIGVPPELETSQDTIKNDKTGEFSPETVKEEEVISQEDRVHTTTTAATTTIQNLPPIKELPVETDYGLEAQITGGGAPPPPLFHSTIKSNSEVVTEKPINVNDPHLNEDQTVSLSKKPENGVKHDIGPIEIDGGAAIAEPITTTAMTSLPISSTVMAPTTTASRGLWPMLKVSGCNIYGRVYRLGSTIGVLSGPCKECKCVETGVDCSRTKCF